MNVDLLIKENKELNEEKQRYKDMWFTTNNSLAKYRKLEEQLGCPLEVLVKAIKNGIWFINEDDKLEYIDEALCFNTKLNTDKLVFDNYGYYCKNIEKLKGNQIYLEDYKKTWWLKEDKSE